MKIVVAAAVAASLAVSWAAPALAFCGFYVAKADAKLFNRASQVVLARHDDKTVLTMANDYKGELRGVRHRRARADGARARPDPRGRPRPHRASRRLLRPAPRGVLRPRPLRAATGADANVAIGAGMFAAQQPQSADRRAKSLGVTIEAQYTVGEYDILILSARESGGLETWLRDNGYRVPAGATAVLGSYLKQGMRFFVAKVNLTEQAKLGFSYLRPLQMAFDTPKFMLPIRLGTLNADGAQELFVYALTRKGGSRRRTTARCGCPPASRSPCTSRTSSRSSTARCSASR